MKTYLKDTTFLIPIRIDSIIRLENCLMTVHFLIRNFDCNIIVLEASGYNNKVLQRMLDKRVCYIFIEDKDEVFYRTKYLNLMTNLVKTPFLGIWDADVIVPQPQIKDSISLLRSGTYEIVLPYDGSCLDTSYIVREYYFLHNEIKFLERNIEKMKLLYDNHMKGGAIFIRTESYIIAGMENENFYGWGSEDYERYDRWTSLNYRIFRIKGPLFHFTHPRGINSKHRSMNQAMNSERTLSVTRQSSRDELLKLIQNNFR
ncbi:hypothetical protein FACS189455_3760 [Bacteroidia bacterium]|nr:hypothetical protein FACS189455_3760 [Bacteroidia bacterium]